MKIIDNPALGIGLLLCAGIAVFGLALLTTADGQSRTPVMVTSDDGAWDGLSFTSSDDFDVSPFLARETTPSRSLEVTQTERVRVEQARAQDVAAQQRVTTMQQRQHAVQIENPLVARPEAENQPDPFAAPPHEQPRYQQRGQQVAIERRIESNPPAAPSRQQVAQAEKRDALLLRIVELRLKRGEYEQLVPVVMQMQNPEKVVEMMLGMAEESSHEEVVAKLLDVATIVLLHLGQPRPPMPGMMGMPGGMGGSVGFGMSGGMMGGPGMPGMMPGQPMPMGGGMPGGMPGQPPPPPMGGGIMPPSQPVMDRLNGSIM